MDKREKVIQAFENCTDPAMNDDDDETFVDCIRAGVCPWDDCQERGRKMIDIPLSLATAALELLKAQEPRVMTLAELWHMEHKPVYLERKNSRLYMTEPSIVLKTERCYIPSIGESYILMRENKIHDTYWACDYNKTWRCWTSRPTDEQRKVTPWE